MSIRPVKRIVRGQPTLEGAGVHLRRVFGFGNTADYDPFLLLDDFRNDEPEEYLAGFPWHPHRGIETITYVLAGTVEHRDSIGNRGELKAGDVQWMTAGSGIIHQEMPKGDSKGRMYGFQLWANLPAAHKMTRPRYQEVKASEIPVITESDGTSVRIVCGRYGEISGPVKGVATEPEYLDVAVPARMRKSFAVSPEHTAFAYVFEGGGVFSESTNTENGSLVLFDAGDEVEVQAGPQGIRFLLVSGRPLRERVAWHGPIVMNTEAELRQAFKELDAGTFLKQHD